MKRLKRFLVDFYFKMYWKNKKKQRPSIWEI